MAPVTQSSAFRLHSLVEDIVILIISFLEPPTIITLSQTCRRLHDFARLRIVWTNACTHHALARGYIFPSTPSISEMSTEHLRYHTLRAYRLTRRWTVTEAQSLSELDPRGLEWVQRRRGGELHPRSCAYIEQTAGMSVSEVRFLPSTTPASPAGSQHLVVTLGKSVWSVLSVWSVTTREGGHDENSSEKIAEWGPRGAIFTGFAVNDISGSEATMAISFQLHERYFVKLLSLSYTSGTNTNIGTYKIIELHTMRTPFVPKMLSGDLLALADDDAWVEVWDWRVGTCAVLEHLDGHGTIQTNECLHVFLSPESESVIVARARSIHIFPWPRLMLDASGDSGNTHDSVDTNPNVYRPLASHSFGWVDGMAINTRPRRTEVFESLPALNILVRGESDDPWASDHQHLEVWTLLPNPEYQASLNCDLTSSASMRSSSSTSEAVPRPGYSSISASLQAISPPFLLSMPSFGSSPLLTPGLASPISPAHATAPEPVSASVSPYIFPPTLTTTIPCLHGALRCKQVALGRFGTAVWIRPPARQGWGTGDWEHSNAYTGGMDLGLTVLTEDVSSVGGGNGMLPSALGSRSLDGRARDSGADSEVLVGVSLNQRWAPEGGGTVVEWEGRDQEANAFFPARGSARAVPILANDTATSWSALDYDEVCGRAVLASSFGRVFILEL